MNINGCAALIVFAFVCALSQKADAAVHHRQRHHFTPHFCRVAAHSWTPDIKAGGGSQTSRLLQIYGVEGLACYVGDIGTSFGPFQLHYGNIHDGHGNLARGMGDVFTRQTGFDARDRSTVPAQIEFMRRWGVVHGGFSGDIWHGLRAHRWHGRHYWHRRHFGHHLHHGKL